MTTETEDAAGEAANREMFNEISALMAGVSKAFDLDEAGAIEAVERGEVEMHFDTDNNGNRFVLARYQGKSARLYAGAIKDESGAEH